ncbi:MAG: hypothetical protein JWN15_3337 [Firmicutes bacterium]|nr:hypothetical protein [Bacillota bacterium]
MPPGHWVDNNVSRAVTLSDPSAQLGATVSNPRGTPLGRLLGQAASDSSRTARPRPSLITGVHVMNQVQFLSLLLALSVALNIAITAGLLAYRSGASMPNALLTGAGAAASSLGVYFAALAAYK